MRNLSRNTKAFYYSLYTGEVEVTTGTPPVGTGVYVSAYATPVLTRGSITAVKGRVVSEVFGLSENYDAVITLFGANPGIDETTLLWIEGTNTSLPYDYIVKQVAPSLNTILIAIKKVNISA